MLGVTRRARAVVLADPGREHPPTGDLGPLPFTGVRQCSRSGCAEDAAVTLTYQYGRALVWLDDLTFDREPHAYDLCERHGARLSVPNGWRLEDRRRRGVVTIASRLAG